MLNEKEQNEAGELFDPYVKEDSLHYCYKVNQDERVERLVQIGKDLARMLKRFEKEHGNDKSYEHALRV